MAYYVKSVASGVNITLDDSANDNLQSLKLSGYCKQDGEPSPDNPQEIKTIEDSVEVKSTGKNLLKYPYIETTKTVKGITFTDNGDGSITVNGTNNSGSSALFWITRESWRYDDRNIVVQPGTYTVSGINSDILRIVVSFYNEQNIMEGGTIFATNKDVTNTTQNKTSLTVRIEARTGYTYDNLTIYPMISLTGGEYEPYQESTTLYNLGDNFVGAIGDVKDEIVGNKLIKRIGRVVLDGSEAWGAGTGGIDNLNRYFVNLPNLSKGLRMEMLSSHFLYSNSWNTDKVGSCFTNNEAIFLYPGITTTASFKTWLSQNKPIVYYILETPYEVELTPVGELKTFDGLTYINNSASAEMEVEYNNKTLNENYENVIYSGQAQNKLYLKVGDVVLTEPDDFCEKVTFTSNILDEGSTNFSLDNFVSKNVELILHDYSIEDLDNEIEIKLGTLINGSYVYIPMGIFKIQEQTVNDKNKTTYKLRDRSVMFDFSYNGKPIIDYHGGTATKLQILLDICEKAGVRYSGSEFFKGYDEQFGLYDNTVTARVYISQIAEQAGCIATITREGTLTFIPITNNLTKKEIPFDLIEKYEIGEKYKVGRVTYDNGKIAYTYPHDPNQEVDGDELFINSVNIYILNQQNIDNIASNLMNFEIDSITTGKVIGNPTIDCYDLITITDLNGNTYKTFGQNELVYNGVLTNTFGTVIEHTERERNVYKDSTQNILKTIRTDLDTANATITTTVTETIPAIETIANTAKGTADEAQSTATNAQSTANTVSGNFNTFLTTTYAGDIQKLQNQIDGAIQFWNGSNIPTLNNYPANEWKTEQDKINHQADIYTVIQDVQGELKQGKSYRFDKVNNTWQWIELTDNELSAVQALASSKAKVFVTTPIPPYSIGDLWLKDNELYRCKTAKDSSGSYSINDWEKATKYTDDTVANAAQSTANTANSKIDNLKIGGRNLSLRTNQGIENWGFNIGNKYKNPTLEEINWLQTNALKVTTNGTNQDFTSTWKLIYYNDKNIQNILEPNQTYTMSFDSTNKHTSISIKKPNGTEDIVKSQTFTFETRTDENGEQYYHLVFVFVTNNNINRSDQYIYITSNMEYMETAGNIIKYANLKVEIGNKATDWTPAPEDINQTIDDGINDTRDQLGDRIDGLNESITGVSGDLENYKKEAENTFLTERQVQTQIEQNSREIVNRVSVLEEDMRTGTETLVNTMVTINKEGINVSKSDSNIQTVMTNDNFIIQTKETVTGQKGTILAHFGYSDGKTIAEMDNLTVHKYLVTGVHRIEEFEKGKRTGVFFIGGNQ